MASVCCGQYAAVALLSAEHTPYRCEDGSVGEEAVIVATTARIEPLSVLAAGRAWDYHLR